MALYVLFFMHIQDHTKDLLQCKYVVIRMVGHEGLDILRIWSIFIHHIAHIEGLKIFEDIFKFGSIPKIMN